MRTLLLTTIRLYTFMLRGLQFQLSQRIPQMTKKGNPVAKYTRPKNLTASDLAEKSQFFFKKKLLTLYTINAHFIRMITPERR
jgi:hypothetical protein